VCKFKARILLRKKLTSIIKGHRNLTGKRVIKSPTYKAETLDAVKCL
jgi:hypothetical protein